MEKMQIYVEYVKKMRAMAEETRQIEQNMQQFASTIQSMVILTHESNPTNNV